MDGECGKHWGVKCVKHLVEKPKIKMPLARTIVAGMILK
jgi:hypothetical protein